MAFGLRWCEIGLSSLHQLAILLCAPAGLFSHSAFKEAAGAHSRGPFFSFHLYPSSSSSILFKKGIEVRGSDIVSL